jgi:hypothetical protein
VIRSRENKNQLMVEGRDDKWSVINLMKAHMGWPEDGAPVWVEDANGRQNILKRESLEAVLIAPYTRTLGVMLDAEDNPPGKTYAQVRNLCSHWFPQLPDELPPSGLIADNQDGKRLGIWIMPDNVSPGTLETFLQFLVPASDEPIWTHATESVKRARAIGAKCREAHIEKANLHTWLAWQDEPGYPPGTALTSHILDPHGESATPFVNWFRELYELKP